MMRYRHVHPSPEPLSCYSRRVIALVEEGGIAYDARVINLMAGEHKFEACIQLNPNGQMRCWRMARAAQKVVGPRHARSRSRRCRASFSVSGVSDPPGKGQAVAVVNRAVTIECTLGAPDRLAHHFARQPQMPRNRLDRLPTRVLAPNPDNTNISPSG